MELIFSKIEITIDWGIIFGLVSILSIAITWLNRKFNITDQKLSVKQASIRKLFSKPKELNDDLKIIFKGEEIEQLNKIDFFLQNSGIKTINSSDFFVEPQIDLSGFTNIINLNVLKSNEFTKCKKNKISPSICELNIDNLESQNYIHIEVIFESISDEYESTFKFRLKEKEPKSIDLNMHYIEKDFGVSQDYQAFMYVTSFAGITALGLSYFLCRYGLGIDLSQPDNFSIGWKFLFFLPTISACIFAIYKWNTIIKKHHFGHEKITDWY